MNNFVRFQLPVLLWALLIFSLSSITKVPDLNKSDLPLDKVIHFIEYCLLGIFLLRGLFYRKEGHIRRMYILYAIIIGVTIGICDEAYQYFVPNRDSNIFDLAADGLGVIFSVFIFQKFLKNDEIYRKYFS